jgi:hypothetical protein
MITCAGRGERRVLGVVATLKFTPYPKALASASSLLGSMSAPSNPHSCLDQQLPTSSSLLFCDKALIDFNFSHFISKKTQQ